MFYSIKLYNKYYIAYFTILAYFLTFQKKNGKLFLPWYYHDYIMVINRHLGCFQFFLIPRHKFCFLHSFYCSKNFYIKSISFQVLWLYPHSHFSPIKTCMSTNKNSNYISITQKLNTFKNNKQHIYSQIYLKC